MPSHLEVLPGEWLYYLAPESMTAVKIGKVSGLHMYVGRFKAIQAMNHEHLWCLAISGPMWNRGERDRHRQFEEDRIHGEWFRPSRSLLIHISGQRLQTPDHWLKEHGLGEWISAAEIIENGLSS